MDAQHSDKTSEVLATGFSRRRMLKQVGIGLVGAAGLAAIGQGQASATRTCYDAYGYPCPCPDEKDKKPKKDKKNNGRGRQGNNGFGNGADANTAAPGNSGNTGGGKRDSVGDSRGPR